MKKNLLTLAVLSTGLFFNIANAQISAKKGVTMEEIYAKLNTLFGKGDDASKIELGKEAAALAASKDETFVSLAARVYENLDQAEKAKSIDNSILKKFPKGIKARAEAYGKIFEDEALEASAVEKQYTAWLKKFPKSSFDDKNQEIYYQGMSKLASMYFKENNPSKATTYIDQLKASPNFANYANTIANGLLSANDVKNALPLLEEAYNTALQAKKSTDPKVSASANRAYNMVVPNYAKALAEQGNVDRSVVLMQGFLNELPVAASAANNVLILGRGYIKQGKDLDAFLTFEKFMIKNGKNEDVVKEIELLYNKLNGNKSDFQAYFTNIDGQIKDALVSKYKSEMIKKEAPSFSLVNRDGKTVSLADMKGKVVVLDFWATWCGPCKISFPGMQASVNKYKDDKEVEFLFIDTWQREENYKDLVNEFITKNNYTFHVLFDEMQDRGKATTTAYGVKGIPHKVVIDKEGFIRFESSGGSADVEKIVNEMETKIELARKG